MMQFSERHRACVYTLPSPDRLLAVEPTARQLSGNVVAVPNSIEAMQRLARLGYPVVSPILHEYDWPGRVTPFPQQYHMAAFMTLHPRCFNLSDMRTGKTLSTLWAADYLMSKGLIKKMLILAPLSTIYRVWEDAIFTHFLGRRTCAVLYGDQARRLSRSEEDRDFYIINHDGLSVGNGHGPGGPYLGDLARSLRDRADIDAICLDEGSLYREPTTRRYRTLREVSGGSGSAQHVPPKPYFWHLTGTPTPNAPTDAWAQVRLVRQDYRESFTGFKERTMVRVTAFKWAPKPGAAKAASDILQPAIRYDRHQCLGTMPVKPEIVDIELTPAQKKAMTYLKRDLRLTLKGVVVDAINEASLRLKLIQISCGAVYGEGREIHKVDAQPRLAAVEELIELSPNKVLVFASLTNVVDLLYSELSKKFTVARVTGSTPAAARNRIFMDFQGNGKERVIVADPRCMSHGLTATAADTIVWFSPCEQPETFAQASVRIEGADQKDKLAVYCLAATPAEREIYRRLESKERLQGAILDLIEGD
jgi:hypothetical protein